MSDSLCGRRVLALYWYPRGQAMRAAVERHLRVLERTGAQVAYVNARGLFPKSLRLARFDAVLLHTTFLGVRWDSDFERYEQRFRWLCDVDAPKIALPQDEYDHPRVLDEWLDSLNVSHVLSNFAADTRGALYPRLRDRATFRQVLTGYVDEEMARMLATRTPPTSSRRVDVVYRTTRLPYWFGSHGQLKHVIGEAVRRRATKHSLVTDISSRPEDGVFGSRWFGFLLSGRAVLGTESGSSVLDRRGEVRSRIRSLLAADPDLTFAEIDRRMPPGWDSARLFASSPRHLEAAVTKTCQILVEGEYSGVLVPERHYLAVRRDLSNLDDVLERLGDDDLLASVAEQAYDDIVRSGRYGYDRLAEEIAKCFADQPAAARASFSSAVIATTNACAAVELASRRPFAEIVRLGRRIPDNAPGARLARRMSTGYRVARSADTDLTIPMLAARIARRGMRRVLAATESRR